MCIFAILAATQCPHRRVDDPRSVCAQRVRDMPNVDRVQMLVVAAALNENLIVQVVQIFRHEQMNISHDLKHVESLLQRLRWKMILDRVQLELALRHEPHLAVRSPIVHRHRRQIVEHLAQVRADVIANDEIFVDGRFLAGGTRADLDWLELNEASHVLQRHGDLCRCTVAARSGEWVEFVGFQ